MEKPKRRATVLIADDHPIVVDGLVALLKDKFDVVGTVSDGTRLLADAIRLRPDIVVTDVSMPGLDGLEVLRRLKEKGSDTRVIVLTMHGGVNWRRMPCALGLLASFSSSPPATNWSSPSTKSCRAATI